MRNIYSKYSYNANRLYNTSSFRKTITPNQLEELLRARYSESNFSNDIISNNIIRKLVELTLLAPSSFNMQPYKIILITSSKMRELIANNAMLGPNGRKVIESPLTSVFIADKNPAKSTSKLMKLMTDGGISYNNYDKVFYSIV
jgi:nitroreductase